MANFKVGQRVRIARPSLTGLHGDESIVGKAGVIVKVGAYKDWPATGYGGRRWDWTIDTGVRLHDGRYGIPPTQCYAMNGAA